MKSTKDLYDLDPKMLETMPYKEALELKRDRAKERLYQKVRMGMNIPVEAAELDKAILHNEYLLNELKEK
jgi:exosome complex RNA-binding protein Rrp4